MYIKDKFISEELRGIAVEKNIIALTASQLGRSAVNEMEVDHSHIAGGISKIQTADNVISIMMTTSMRDRGQLQYQFLKTRSSSGVGSKVILGHDINTLRIYDLEMDDEIEQPAKSAVDLMADLRRRNSTKEEIVDSPEVKNVSTLMELTKLVRR